MTDVKETPPATDSVNDALLQLGAKTPDGKWNVPALTMKVILLLQKVNSPFVASPDVVYDADGKPRMQSVPALDGKGVPITKPNGDICEVLKPVTLPREQGVDDIIKAFWVITNNKDPRILSTIANPDELDRIIFEYAGVLGIADIREIARQISVQMESLNTATGELGEDGAAEKNQTGPTGT